MTDVMIGCDPRRESYGQITDVQVFDRLLTADEMIGMTTCSGEKLSGNIINTNDHPFTLYGEQVKQVQVNVEMICPLRRFSAVYLGYSWRALNSIEICKKLNRNLLSVTSEEDLDSLKFYISLTGHSSGWVHTPIHKHSNGSWLHVETGKPSILPWGVNKLIDNDLYIYSRIELDLIALGSQPGSWGMSAICVSDNPADYRLSVSILGLCRRSTFDKEYVFSSKGGFNYVGRFNSSLRHKDGNWVLSNKPLYDWFTDQEVKIGASYSSLALGTHFVRFEEDDCTKGKEDKVVQITITNCNEDQFTCFTGGCVLMENRCDRIVDCEDSSDEKGCAIVRIDETTYIREYPPITVDGDRTLIKLPINISLDILKILEINEVEGVFEVSFRLHSTWVDERLTYANLNNNSNLNTLTEKEKGDIWTPNIVFSNTKSQDKVIKDTDVIAKISRFGSIRVGGTDEAIKTFYFKGADNPITFSRIYDIRFICSYNMAWYPFDLQRCELLLKPFGNTGEYIFLVNNHINYYDKMDLSKYYIKQWKFESKETDTGFGVEGKLLVKFIMRAFSANIIFIN